MATFRALPPSLRPVVRSKVADTNAQSIHVPVARAMVDCGVYVDGQRLPGKYTHAGALAKARELEHQGKEAFVWIGLHEPDEHQMQTVADVFGLHELAVEARSMRISGRSWNATTRRCFWSSKPSNTWSTNPSPRPAKSSKPARL